MGAVIGYFGGTYPRGSDTFIQREIAGLRALGHDVRAYALRRPDEGTALSAFAREELGRTAYILDGKAGVLAGIARGMPSMLGSIGSARHLSRPGVRGAVMQAAYLAEAAVLARRLKGDGVGHLHCHYPDANGTVAVLAAKIAGITYSLHIHGPDVFWDAEAWRLREKIEGAAFGVCISNYARSQVMLRVSPEHWGKLHIVHCGVEPGSFSPRGPVEEIKKLVFVGRLAAAKGLDVLLEAVRLVREAGRDVELRIIGDGPDRARLETASDAMGLGGCVRFEGALPNERVAAILAESDAFVMASFAEGVPVVLMEAMAAGVPVIATRIAGIPELIGDGVSGLLMTPGDAAGLRDAVLAAGDDLDATRRRAGAGRAVVGEEFDCSLEAERFGAIVDGYVNGGEIPPIRPTGRGRGADAAAENTCEVKEAGAC